MFEYFCVKKPNIEEAKVIRLAFYVDIYIYIFFSHFLVHVGTFITGLEDLSHFTLYIMLDDHIFIDV